MSRMLLMLIGALACAGCGAPRSGFEAILQRQAAAWNRGDIQTFMQDYWQSDQLTFSSGGQTRHGWKETRDRYLARYPNREAMGTLRFSLDRIDTLANDAALVLGQWDLERSAGPIGGNFSLVFRRIGGRWLIVHDHTSGRESAPAASQPAAAGSMQNVTAGCGMCVFHMPGVNSCLLAVRTSQGDFLVSGRAIDQFGDAHAADGLCNAARAAVARGELKDGKFVVSEMRLAP